jgi:DNA modification methylase
MRTKTDLLTSASRPNFDAIRLHIEYVSPADISIGRRSLHKHSPALIKKLAAGIDRTGPIIPLIVDEQLGLVLGHDRLAAMLALGMEHVPVIPVAHLTEAQLQLFRIFEEKIAKEFEWDEEALALTFTELRLSEPEVVLTDSGFSIGGIDALEGRLRTKELNDLDDACEPHEKREPISRRGELWLCGRHRLICGDSTDPGVIDELVGEAPICQVIADLPYNLPTKAFSTSGMHGDFAAGAGEMSEEEFTRFIRRFFMAAIPHLRDGALLYTFMDWRHIVELVIGAQAAGLNYKQLLVWVKGSAGMGSFYRSGYELVGVFKYGNAPARNNIQLGKYGRNRSNVLSYPGVMGTGGRKKALASHPTVKNIALIADLMLDASAPGEAVLDSFGGSGTTLIAAEKTDRVAYLCELSPRYVDVTLERWRNLDLGEPVLAATGQTFSEVAAERQVPSSDGEQN